ncbi:hypothetical protein [Sinimarinibacterium flocculans]|uniref:Uncharacterized protein n=1 Tax=Sinimarinibacterium flocculans TaxID=985250 RepID=A0A318E8W1_9GAMM|nr:hypothetical protein [Sinimarinibacterium flocculans]PXV65730.1 hypothetical protein C8D93_109109 [Sinimarinibacterium flocculans]
MGMDVFGKAPTSEQGTYFRNNVWWWHPLWQYCEEIAPDLIPPDNLGHSNDGWGLGSDDAIALADRLASTLASGETERYAKRYVAYLETLPPQRCDICGGTGKRAEPPQIGPGPLNCNSCSGAGTVPHFDTHYPFSIENVREFEAFLRTCGGFEIC